MKSRTIDITKWKNQVDNLQAIHEQIDRVFDALQNGTYTITISKRKSGRTLDQNALMWLWFACVADETGNTLQEVYDHYTNKFLSVEFIFGGVNERATMGTSKLTKEQFTIFLQQVQADAASELGIILPDPSEHYFDEFREMYRHFTPTL